MKKFFLSIFILVDLAIMVASGFFLYLHLTSKHLTDYKTLPGMSSLTALMGHPAAPPNRTTAPTGVVTPPAAPGVAPAASPAAVTTPTVPGARKILFSYRNPHARKVSIRADFTGWKAEPMIPGAHGVWTYQAGLTPGEYAYVYTADDRTFSDPANKRTKRIGTTLVSAILVKPAPGH